MIKPFTLVNWTKPTGNRFPHQLVEVSPTIISSPSISALENRAEAGLIGETLIKCISLSACGQAPYRISGSGVTQHSNMCLAFHVTTANGRKLLNLPQKMPIASAARTGSAERLRFNGPIVGTYSIAQTAADAAPK
jgi:hypothetical protein